MSGKPSFTIGYATSDQCRVSCMASEIPINSTDAGSSKETLLETCNDPIVAGSVLILQKNSKGEITHYHLECFAEIRQRYQFFDAGTDLPGYSELQRQDQKHVKTCLPEIEPAVPAKKRKVMSPDTAEPEDPKMARPNGVDQLPPTNQFRMNDRDIDETVTDFEELSTKHFYIDKTLLIHEVLNDKTAMLITAPRRQGKSTMLSMLKYFFQIHTHKKEKVISSDVKSGKPVIDNSELFKGRNVEEKPETMKHRGKYPVIHLNLAGDPKTAEEALAICRTAIHVCYREHKYLEQSTVIDAGDRGLVKTWCDREKYKTMDWDDVKSDVRALSGILKQHWGGKDCIILIDEYDAMMMNCLCTKSMTADDFDDIKKPISDMLGFAVKHNLDQKIAIITGISFVTGLWSSSLNHIAKYRFLGNHNYGTLYGLTAEEVKMILRRKGIPDDQYEGVEKYYNGYITLRGESVYNIWTILKYLEDPSKLKPHWTTTGMIYFLAECFRSATMRQQIYPLMTPSQSAEVLVYQQWDLIRIEQMKEFAQGSSKTCDPNAIFSLFFEQGALSYAGISPVPQSAEDKEKQLPVLHKLKIPNKEVRAHFQMVLSGVAEEITTEHAAETQELKTRYRTVFDVINAPNMLHDALKEFLNALEILARAYFPEKDVAHDTLRILFCSSGGIELCPEFDAEVYINNESVENTQDGKPDFCGVNKETEEKFGVLIEFKINSTIQAAKNQILTRNYIGVFHKCEKFQGTQRVLVIGLNVDTPPKTVLNQKQLKPLDPFKCQLTYALHKMKGDFSTENKMLKETEWKEITLP